MRNYSNTTTKFQNLISSSFLFLLFTFFAVDLSNAQVPMKAKDNRSSVNISDFERINLYDGQFSFALPLASIGGRGGGTGFSLRLDPSWRRDEIIVGYSGATPNVLERIDPDPYAMTGIFPSVGGYLVGNTQVVSMIEIANCSNESRFLAGQKSFALNFSGFGGQSFSFIAEQNDGDNVVFSQQGCSGYKTAYIGTVFLATDGSGTKFISDGSIGIIDDPVGEGYGTANIYPSGMLRFPDGSSYRIDGGLVSWTQDRNGNRTYLTNTGFTDDIRENRVTSVKDPLNREIQTSIDSTSSYVTYKGTGGASRSIKVTPCNGSSACLRSGQSTLYLHDLFSWIASDHPSNRLITPTGIKEVELPNGQKYRFYYNSYLELARVELPTGGAVEYDYETVGSSLSTQRRITERRVYTNGSSLDNKTTYEYSDSIANVSGSTIPSERWTKVRLYDNQNVLKSLSKEYFYGCSEYCTISNNPADSVSKFKLLSGRPFKVDIYDSDGTTLLRRTETSYEARRRTTWTYGTNSPYVDYRVTEVISTLADSMQVSKVTYGYDSAVGYNLQTDTYEYGYGSYAPGSFVRRSHTDYEKGSSYTSNSVNILNLPTQSWVSSDMSENAKVSLTVFEYDNYSSVSPHAGLIDCPSITGHGSSFGTSYTTRGNLTGTTSYSSAAGQSGGVSSYIQYDIAGNVVKTFDANGHAATADYSDRFGSPDYEATSNTPPSLLNGLSTFAFATSSTNRAGWITGYVQRDFYTGAVVNAEDMNGNVSATFYADSLDRPTETITNNNRSTMQARATVSYDDTNRKVTVEADSKGFGDKLIKSEAYYDGFGRTTESRDYETSTNYIKTATEYDPLGRAYRSCYPYRPYLSETPQWTTSKFDSLGRVYEVKTADNAAVTRAFYGSISSVTDQKGHSRAGTSDALGRMTNVTEYDNGAQYESIYSYDVLGRLRKTAQTSGSTTQYRYFMYNDLGRLVRAKQVEQVGNTNLNTTDPVTNNSSWSVGYSYDPNGNISTTTDALNRTITGTYDVLNRLILRDYSDSTPDVSFTYDDQSISNSKGHLTAVSSSVSTTNYTAFDILGRINSSSQTTGGQTYNFSDYSYDLSGALVSETYPNGRIVTTETDDLGRLSAVKSQLPNDVQKTMLSQLDYTSFGAVKHAKLGNGKWESVVFDNKRLQVTQIGLGGSAGDTSLLKLEFDYGTTTNNGALMQQKITVPGAANQITQNYDYDYLNRLHSATETVTGNSTPTWKQTFTYDRFGNRRFDANNTTTFGSCSQAVCNPNIDLATNQLSTSDGYSFNNEGNLTANPESQTFTYDAENRQTQVYNSSTQTTASYQYDGGGKRVKKTIGNEETYFVYDAFGKLVAEYTLNQTPTQNGTQYMTADALGSPRAITNAIGAVVSRRDFMPYGEEIMANIGGRTTTQGYGQPDNARQKFTGYERDDESGLDFAKNRYYSGKHGRFTSVDPLATSAIIKAPQTLNRYSYGNNSPYKFTDSTGLISESQYDGTQDKIDQGRRDEDELRKKQFNQGLARYIFERASQGYMDDTGGMTESMFTISVVSTSGPPPPPLGNTEPFVISNVDELAKQADAGTHPGYQSKDPDGKMDYECAELPQSWQNEQEGLGSRVPDSGGSSDRQRRLTPNWTQGAPVVGTNVRSGTVLASGWQNGKYLSLEGGNHVIIIHLWGNNGGQKGAWVISTVHAPPKYEFKTDSELGKFSVVMIPTRAPIQVYQPPRDCTTCRFYDR